MGGSAWRGRWPVNLGKGEPTDVSEENLSFDMQCGDEKGQEICYIDVENLARASSVALAQNERFKAQRCREAFYLYAVIKPPPVPSFTW